MNERDVGRTGMALGATIATVQLIRGRRAWPWLLAGFAMGLATSETGQQWLDEKLGIDEEE